MSKKDIREMSDDDLLDMDYFLNEDEDDIFFSDDSEGFFIFSPPVSFFLEPAFRRHLFFILFSFRAVSYKVKNMDI